MQQADEDFARVMDWLTQCEEDEDRECFYSAFSGVRVERQAKAVLEMALSDRVRNQNAVMVINAIAGIPEMHEVVRDFVTAHFSTMLDVLEGGYLMERLLQGVLGSYQSDSVLPFWDEFFQPHMPVIGRGYRNAREALLIRARFMEHQRDDIIRFLQKLTV